MDGYIFAYYCILNVMYIHNTFYNEAILYYIIMTVIMGIVLSNIAFFLELNLMLLFRKIYDFVTVTVQY